VFVNAGLGRMVQLINVISSSYEFRIKKTSVQFPVISTTKAERVQIDWEVVIPYNEPTLIVLYFLGTYNDVRVAHPYKILLTVV
jgi:hypothetical protein